MNYVAPTARFHGVSTALLAALETGAAERGNVRCSLLNTETAHRFYLSRGYRDEGPPVGKFGSRGDIRCPSRSAIAGDVGRRPAMLRHLEIEIRPHRHMV